MSPSNRPRLSHQIELDIETAKNQMHIHYWPRLQQMQELTEDARNQYQRLRRNIAPPSPRSPQALRSLLRQYASHVFESEATYYPDEKDLEYWLQRLSGKVIAEIVQRVVQVENVGRAHYVTLDYHGLTRDDMISAIREGAMEAARSRLESMKQQQKEPKLGTKTVTEPEALTAKARQSLVDPMLANKGWSLLDWANEAEVAYNTVAGYLAGKKTYPSTKVKLAKALGLEANQLP
jgi:lambda repressor-like predicted transcriptional regulator